jgi:hypothetical protein
VILASLLLNGFEVAGVVYACFHEVRGVVSDGDDGARVAEDVE